MSGEVIPIIDIHTHIIPGVDDGCRSMDEARKMLILAYEQGVRAVVATPHYLGADIDFGYEERIEELKDFIKDDLPGLKIYLGQETYYGSSLVDALNNGKAYTIAGSRYVLVEFAPSVPFSMMKKGLRDISAYGYRPVVAHIERYECLRNKGNLMEVLATDCCLQMNFESLQGSIFDKNVRWCRKQIKDGVIDLLGSDMHRLDFRPPEIGGAMKWLKKRLDAKVVKKLVYGNALKILRDRNI